MNAIFCFVLFRFLFHQSKLSFSPTKKKVIKFLKAQSIAGGQWEGWLDWNTIRRILEDGLKKKNWCWALEAFKCKVKKFGLHPLPTGKHYLFLHRRMSWSKRINLYLFFIPTSHRVSFHYHLWLDRTLKGLRCWVETLKTCYLLSKGGWLFKEGFWLLRL